MTTLSDLTRSADVSRGTALAPKSFSSYLKENGAPAKKLSTAVNKAIRTSRISSPNYGTLAEDLADKGLSRSGYRDYLSGQAEKTKKETIQSAYADYLADKRTAEAGYSEYLAKVADKALSHASDVTRYAQRQDTVDQAEIAKFARLLGFGEKDAVTLASQAAQSVLNKRRTSVLDAVVKQNMTADEANAYARAFGLSDADSRSIAAFAKKRREAILQGIELPLY